MRFTLVCLMSAVLLIGCNKVPEPSTDHQTSTKIKTDHSQQTKSIQCKSIDETMSKINAQSQINDLKALNQLLKPCLKMASNQQQIQWLHASTMMYKRFLKDSEYDEKAAKAFEDYGFSILDQEPTQTTEKHNIKGDHDLFKKLAPRDQYLIRHQREAYIEMQYVGEGLFEYRRHPHYLLEVFAPYLPRDQRQFIQRMAQDNQEILFNDAAITVSWKELIARALFWEKYIQQYPKSHFISDARRLYDEYSYFVFLGLDNTPVSDEYAPNSWIDEDALKQIKALAQRQESALAAKAHKFLIFIATPIELRNAQFKMNMRDENGQLKQQNQLTQEQLKQLLALKSPWSDEPYRDCHTDAICTTVQY